MKLVRFMCNSSGVKPNLSITSFLRLNGIYVYEKFFDFNRLACEYMFRPFDIGGIVPFNSRYDLEILSVSDEYELMEISKYNCHDNGIILIPDRYYSKNNELLLGWEVINYDIEEDGLESELLYKILDSILRLGLISEVEYRAFQHCAEVYCSNHVLGLLYKTKYFYTVSGQLEYENLIGQYRKLYDDLTNCMRSMNVTWGDTETLNIQYAVLRVAYETDLYCRRNKKSLVFQPDSIIRICSSILNNSIANKKSGDSINLLISQVLDDITSDKTKAYRIYSKLGDGFDSGEYYNSYAYYRKAIYLMNSEGDYTKAVQDLARCVRVYPLYTRAWYQLGVCYNKLGNWKDAVSAFENVEFTLSHRVNNNVLKPIESEYLFKALCLSADILQNKLYNITKALNSYILAEHIWDCICESRFLSEIGLDNHDNMYKRIKNSQDIQRLYVRLAGLYSDIGYKDKEQEYINKIY